MTAGQFPEQEPCPESRPLSSKALAAGEGRGLSGIHIHLEEGEMRVWGRKHT